MDQTARFQLPLLAAGQAQKEWFHNEALQRIDALLCPVVEGPPIDAPPAGPEAGQCHVIAAGATGDWTGQDGSIAAFTDGGWRFVAPAEGMAVLDRVSGEAIIRRSGTWETGIVRAQEVRVDGQTVLRERQPTVAAPSGGITVDTECRSAVAAMLAALQAHGLIA